jgi:hypothetical protein
MAGAARVGADLAALGLTVAAYWQLRSLPPTSESGTATLVDPLIALTPTLALITARSWRCGCFPRWRRCATGSRCAADTSTAPANVLLAAGQYSAPPNTLWQALREGTPNIPTLPSHAAQLRTSRSTSARIERTMRGRPMRLGRDLSAWRCAIGFPRSRRSARAPDASKLRWMVG